jgi:hypothetical protein
MWRTKAKVDWCGAQKSAATCEDFDLILLDDVFGSSVPKGNLANRLLLALGALLSVGGFP